jgi:hypothetical protein
MRNILSAIVVALAGGGVLAGIQGASIGPVESLRAEYPIFDEQAAGQIALGRAVRALSERPLDSLSDDQLKLAINQLSLHGNDTDVVPILAQLATASPARELIGWQALAGLSIQNYERRQAVPEFRKLAAPYRRRLALLPPEDAARADWTLTQMELRWDPTRNRGEDYRAQRGALIERYADTDFAEDLSISALGEGDYADRAILLERYANEHPRSRAGAVALKNLAEYLYLNAVRGETDALPRLQRVAAIVDQLEHGGFASAADAAGAARYITGFHAPARALPAESAPAMLEIYKTFTKTHFVLNGGDPLSNGVGYLISSKMQVLFEKIGDPNGLDAFLDDLSTTAGAGEIAWLRAHMSLRRAMNDRSSPAEAVRAFEAIAADPSNTRAPVALATIGNIWFYWDEDGKAAAAYRRYIAQYPNSEWTWLAGLRLGRALEVTRDWPGAIAAYRAAAIAASADAPARVMGRHLAAQVAETQGDFGAALEDERRALASWDSAFGQSYDMALRRQAVASPVQIAANRLSISQSQLQSHVDALVANSSSLAGRQLLMARQAFARGEWADAQRIAASAAANAEAGVTAAALRELMHRAAAELALSIASSSPRDVTRARLATIVGQPIDFGVLQARVSASALDYLDGDTSAGELDLDAALKAWTAYRKPRAPASDIERDVAAIRAVVFQPKGAEIYGSGRWNAFDWSSVTQPFVVVQSNVVVTLPGGQTVDVDLVQSLPVVQPVIWLSSDEMAAFSKVFDTLGGSAKRQPTGVMETPNQPAGDSTQILRLINSRFAARAGHWGGWEIETYPAVRQIYFLDAARTHATAHVTIGFSGATVVLRKIDGQWKAVDLVDQWIT